MNKARSEGTAAPRLPDFIVIGAMKAATTTLHKQLGRQPGVVMSRPKEPNFFSDDAIYARGLAWYASLFAGAPEGALCGESSTHYTKLPTHPRTVERMARAIPRPKLIYVLRHPIDRLLSHYVHDRTTGRIAAGLARAIDLHPELVDYGRYAMQLRPYFEAFGAASLLPVFFEGLAHSPQAEIERISRFLGAESAPRWDASLPPQNVGSERLRRSPILDALVRTPILGAIRKSVVPPSWSEPIKALWRAGIERPRPSAAVVARLRDAFDPDLAELGDRLGLRLDCDTFLDAARGLAPRWVDPG